MPTLEDEFGDVIRKARTGQGKTAAAVARRTAIAEQRLSYFESYRETPRRQESDALAGELDLDADSLWEVALEQYVPEARELPAGLQMESFTFTGMDSHGYLIQGASGGSILIDPGGAPDRIVAAIKRRSWSLDGILLTHGHGDHVAGLDGVRAEFTVPVYAHRQEWSGDDMVDISATEHFEVGGFSIEILACPGHTAHGVTFVFDGVAAVGDTMFAGSLGGPLEGERFYPSLLESAKRILSLPDQTILLPGHGPATTVAEEKNNNPFMAHQYRM